VVACSPSSCPQIRPAPTTARLRSRHLGLDRRDDRPLLRPAGGRLESDGTTSVQTSTTNIGAYMWSAVAAERLGFIS
jgi:hypothetical protein